jgi:hypothetical protein
MSDNSQLQNHRRRRSRQTRRCHCKVRALPLHPTGTPEDLIQVDQTRLLPLSLFDFMTYKLP